MPERLNDQLQTDEESHSEPATTDRRGLLKKGLAVVGAGAIVSPIATIRGSAHDAGRFEIWAADHIEIDYRFAAEGPVEPISHPAEDIGAELGGNDKVEYIGNGKYRGYGRTGFGKNDLWRSGTLNKIVITDARK